jgi:carbohydrate kinase (thermoresistant glucokinase family)
MVERAPPTILLLMGVSGCGKSTTGRRLAKKLGWPFRDADSFHPPANIAKMSAGQPLADEDRWPWLDAIGEWLDLHRKGGTRGIVSCSALKRVYRHRLMHNRPEVRLVYLKGSRKLIADRLTRRRGHFMPPMLLESQFETLEEPRGSEHPIVINVAMPPNRVVQRILVMAGLSPSPEAGVRGGAAPPTGDD